MSALGAPAAAQPAGPSDAGATQEKKIWASCTEHVPDGALRPTMTVTFPDRGLSGYEARLEVVIRHGPGETVLPEGFRIQRGSDAFKAIEQAGFVIPHVDGGSPPSIEVEPVPGESTTTTVRLPFVPLPEEAGRHLMVLPPIPIAVARASGQVMTLCTEAQTITVEDPIANEAEPEVRGNPPPRPQREPWPLAKQLFFGGLGAIVLGILIAWLITRWLRRPKPAKPKPRVLPWIWAMKELETIRRSSLITEGRNDEYFDRVSDCVRKYLGDRYGFDGLESTTDEILQMLRRIRPEPPEKERIDEYLLESAFIKFADIRATIEDCKGAMERAERIVTVTTPRTRPAAGPTATAAADDDPRRAA
ncbi:MAG: hypothetical protein JRI23_34525 [Deltaproteobacteria bacterium]|nr:hypothetical protein [Deltaproteobacteria bacterium]MBW2537415.1 hypothetical protein [Deltaproteobacteria bacterium]